MRTCRTCGGEVLLDGKAPTLITTPDPEIARLTALLAEARREKADRDECEHQELERERSARAAAEAALAAGREAHEGIRLVAERLDGELKQTREELFAEREARQREHDNATAFRGDMLRERERAEKAEREAREGCEDHAAWQKAMTRRAESAEARVRVLEGALEQCERYIQYGDGQSQDLSGVVSRGREREPASTRPTRGEALNAARAALKDAPAVSPPE